MGPPRTVFENPTCFRIIYYFQVFTHTKKIVPRIFQCFYSFLHSYGRMLRFSLFFPTSPLNTLCSVRPARAPVSAAPSRAAARWRCMHTPLRRYRPARPGNRGARRFWFLLRRVGGNGNCLLTLIISGNEINIMKIPIIKQELSQEKGFSSLLRSQWLTAVRLEAH